MVGEVGTLRHLFQLNLIIDEWMLTRPGGMWRFNVNSIVMLSVSTQCLKTTSTSGNFRVNTIVFVWSEF